MSQDREQWRRKTVAWSSAVANRHRRWSTSECEWLQSQPVCFVNVLKLRLQKLKIERTVCTSHSGVWVLRSKDQMNGSYQHRCPSHLPSVRRCSRFSGCYYKNIKCLPYRWLCRKFETMCSSEKLKLSNYCAFDDMFSIWLNSGVWQTDRQIDRQIEFQSQGCAQRRISCGRAIKMWFILQLKRKYISLSNKCIIIIKW